MKPEKTGYQDNLKLYDDWFKLFKSKGKIINTSSNPEGRPGNATLRKNYEFIKQKMIYEYKFIIQVESMGKYYMLTKAGERAAEIGMEKYVKELKYKEDLEIENIKSNIKTAKRSLKISIFALAISAIAPILAVIVGVHINKKENIENTINKHPKYYKQNIQVGQDSITDNITIKDAVDISNEFVHD